MGCLGGSGLEVRVGWLYSFDVTIAIGLSC